MGPWGMRSTPTQQRLECVTRRTERKERKNWWTTLCMVLLAQVLLQHAIICQGPSKVVFDFASSLSRLRSAPDSSEVRHPLLHQMGFECAVWRR